MVPRVHDDAADFGPQAHMPCPSGLAEVLVLVIQVGNLADGGHALQADTPDLAGGKPHRSEIALLGEELSRYARGADDLAALARNQLDVVDRGAERDVGEGQRVAEARLGLGPGDDHVSDL